MCLLLLKGDLTTDLGTTGWQIATVCNSMTVNWLLTYMQPFDQFVTIIIHNVYVYLTFNVTLLGLLETFSKL